MNKSEAHDGGPTNENNQSLHTETYENQIPSESLASPAFYTTLGSATHQTLFGIALMLTSFLSWL